MADKFKYLAFISYSHRDKAWGDWLHRALESYRVPKWLIGTEGRDGPLPARLFPIFRDREELPTAHDLPAQIQNALEDSAYLIVICSPSSAGSRWVNEEILTFKRLGRENRILAIIVDGEPSASDKQAADSQALECFAPALMFQIGADGVLSRTRCEPIAADARDAADGKENAKLKLIAGLLGVSYDALKQRDLEARRHRRRIYGAIAASILLLAVGAGIATFEAIRLDDQSLTRQSLSLANLSQQALSAGNVEKAVLVALEGLPGEARRPDVPEANAALARAMAMLRPAATIPGEQIAISPDGKTIFTRVSFQNIYPIVIESSLATGLPVAAPVQESNFELFDEPFTGKGVIFSSNGRPLIADYISKNVLKLYDFHTNRAWGHAIVLTRGCKLNGRIALSPDLQSLATICDGSGKNSVLTLWNIRTGKPVSQPVTNSGTISAPAFSPDGSRLLSIHLIDANHSMAMLWNTQTGMAVGSPILHAKAIDTAVFSANSRLVATSSGNAVRLWNAQTGTESGAHLKLDGLVSDLVFSSNATRLLAISDTGEQLWDTATGSAIGQFADGGSAVALSQDGTRLAVVSRDSVLKLFDAGSGTELGDISHLPSKADGVAFSPDGAQIVVTLADSSLQFFNAAAGAPAGPHLAFEAANINISWSYDARATFTPDGQYVILRNDVVRVLPVADLIRPPTASATAAIVKATFIKGLDRVVTISTDNKVQIWDAHTLTAVGSPITFAPAVLGENPFAGLKYLHVAASPCGRYVIAAGTNKDVQVWDVETGRAVGVKLTLPSLVIAIALSPDGRRFLVSTLDGSVSQYDSASAKQIGDTMRPGKYFANELLYSPDGRRIITSWGAAYLLWDAATGREIASLAAAGRDVWSAEFAPDSRTVMAMSGSKPLLWLWDAKTGHLVGKMQGKPMGLGYHKVMFSPDGSKIASIWHEDAIKGLGTVEVRDAHSFARIIKPIANQEIMPIVAFSPKGDRVAITFDGSIQVYEMPSGRQLWSSTLQDQYAPNTVIAMTFNKNGDRIVGATNYTLWAWDAGSGEELGYPIPPSETRAAISHLVSMESSPDGSRYIGRSMDTSLRLFDAATGVLLDGFAQSDGELPPTFDVEGQQRWTISNNELALRPVAMPLPMEQRTAIASLLMPLGLQHDERVALNLETPDQAAPDNHSIWTLIRSWWGRARFAIAGDQRGRFDSEIAAAWVSEAGVKNMPPDFESALLHWIRADNISGYKIDAGEKEVARIEKANLARYLANTGRYDVLSRVCSTTVCWNKAGTW